jgi:hypothetical protein
MATVVYLGHVNTWMQGTPYQGGVMNRLNTAITEAANGNISPGKTGGILKYEDMYFQEYKSGTHTQSANAPRFFGFHFGPSTFCIAAIGIHVRTSKKNQYEGMTWLGAETFRPTFMPGGHTEVTEMVPAAFDEYLQLGK